MVTYSIIYARVSTEEQKEGYSLEAQIEACQKYCKEQGYRVQAVFQEVFSGTKFDRPELDKVLDLAENKKFEVLVAIELDRLARSAEGRFMIERELNKNGVKVEYANQRFDDSPEGDLTKNIMSAISEFEVANLKRRSKRGSRKRARSGKIKPGRVSAYGYDYDPETGQYIVNEEQAKVVRDIFRWYTKGDGKKANIGRTAIARKLTSMGIPTKWDLVGLKKPTTNVGVWTHGAVGAILTNENYKGEYIYAKESDSPISVKIPAIVSEEEWDVAQIVAERNKMRSKRRQKYEYLLARRMRCNRCGYKFYSYPRYIKGKEYLIYRCAGGQSRYSPDGNTIMCPSGQLRADEVDEKVWEYLKSIIKDPENIRIGIKEYQEKENLEDLHDDIDSLKERLEEHSAKQERIISLFADGNMPRDILDRQIKEVNSQIDEVQDMLSELERKQIKINWEELENLESQIELISSTIDKFDFEERLRVVDLFGVSAIIHREKENAIEVICEVGEARWGKILE